MTTAAASHTTPTRHTAWLRGLMLSAVVAGSWALSTSQAQAWDNVYWSIGVQSPGVAVGVSHAPPMVVHQTYPVYQPRPVYQQRPIVIQHVPVVVQQSYTYGHVRPIVVAPAPSYHPGRGHGPRWDDRGPNRGHKGQHKRYDGGGRHDGRHDHHRH